MKTIIELKRKCPACGWGFGEVLHNMRMKLPDEFKIRGEYDIVCCDNCGNCFADTQASESDYDYYYGNHNYYGGWQGNSSSRHDINVITRSLSNVVGKDARIIDVGFGNGKLLSELKEMGFTNLLGIDPSEKAVSDLRKIGIAGNIGSIYEKPKEMPDKADVVIFMMVLEHLLFPDKAIGAIKENLLKDDGIVVVTWPYFEDLVADASPMVNNFNHEHINYFSKKTADLLFSRFGFENIDYHVSLAVCQNQALQFSNVAMYRRRNGAVVVKNRNDDTTKKSILEYVNRIRQKEEQVFSVIGNIANSDKEVVIWGSGAYLFYLMQSSALAQCNIKYIVDNNTSKQGKSLFGYNVKSPEELHKFEGTVIVTAMLYGLEIQKQIESLCNDKLECVLAF